MIYFSFFTFAIFFSLRYLILFFLGKSKSLSLAGVFFYLILAIPLAESALADLTHGLKIKIPLVILFAGMAGYPLFIRLRQSEDKIRSAAWKSSLLHSLALVLGIALIGVNSIENLRFEKPILKICMTGNVENREMRWKSPDGPLQQSNVEYHEVILRTTDDNEVARFFLPGELVALRARTFRFPAFLNALGISTKYRLDLIYSGYRAAEQYQRFPVQVHPVPLPSSALNSLLFKFWESFFVREADSFWIKSATLESSYFPMAEKNGKPVRGEFFLSISSFGLSSP